MEQQELNKAIESGKIFVYPTDTIYGLGCNAQNSEAVDRIREIKQRDLKPFSVIAPSLKWIKDNCIVDFDLKEYLPGPYTIILKKKDPHFLSGISNTDSIGVRIPKNSFCKRIQKSGFPFVTTSVNLSGQKPANSISEISKDIKSQVDFIIDTGKLSGKPSTLVVDGKELER